jgi:uncharacterized membrane protein
MEFLKQFLQGRWLNHPLHPVLVHLPTALWPASLVFDLLAWRGIDPAGMRQTAFYAILAGLLAALLAIPAGFADWLDIRREKPAWKIGLAHMLLNLLITGLWIANLVLRSNPNHPASDTLLLSAGATLLLLISGYLGGRMIYGYGINVARLSKKKWRQIAAAGRANLPPDKMAPARDEKKG